MNDRSQRQEHAGFAIQRRDDGQRQQRSMGVPSNEQQPASHE